MQAEARATDKLLAAAVRLLGIRDPELVSMDEVAQEAGLSRGLIIYHFGSFEGLKKVVLEYLLFRFRQVWVQPANISWVQRLTTFADLIQDEPGLFRLYVNLGLRAPALHEINEFRADMCQSLHLAHHHDDQHKTTQQAEHFCAWWEGMSLRLLHHEHRGEELLKAAEHLTW